MLRFLKFVVVAPIAILLLVFAFANRQFVTVSFDPFVSGEIPAFAIEAPLFVVLILSAMVGVVAGRRGDLARARQASPRRTAQPRRSRAMAGRGRDGARRPSPAERRAAALNGASVMRHFSAADIDAALDFPSLIDALAEAFRGGFHAPQRHHHESSAPASRPRPRC